MSLILANYATKAACTAAIGAVFQGRETLAGQEMPKLLLRKAGGTTFHVTGINGNWDGDVTVDATGLITAVA